MMIRVSQLWIFSLRFLQLCSAQVLECTVTQDARGTLYSVPEFTASKCHYGWSNITDHVLANHMGKTEKLVKENSGMRLLLSECFEMIRYWRDCISEGIQLEANCTTSCSGNPAHQSWEAGTAVGIAAAVVGFLVIAGLCRKYRNHICRPWNMPKPYDAVMMQNGRHDEAQRRDNAV